MNESGLIVVEIDDRLSNSPNDPHPNLGQKFQAEIRRQWECGYRLHSWGLRTADARCLSAIVAVFEEMR